MTEKLALAFKALSDENRLVIMQHFQLGEVCGCTLIDKLPISQPTLSYHLNLLHDAGLTSMTKDGTWKKYRINEAEIERLIDYLQSLKADVRTCDHCG